MPSLVVQVNGHLMAHHPIAFDLENAPGIAILHQPVI